jgi:hypothetical protein
MGWSPQHKPIREKYSPVMNAEEKRYQRHVRLQPCFGCGSLYTTAHHTLLRFPEKRWRRDHRFLLPVCAPCHTMIHDRYGNEESWLALVGRKPEEAIAYMAQLWEESNG